MKSDYIFQKKQNKIERARLKLIETVFDQHTKEQINATGLKKGWHCLEIGPGGGSILRWLNERAGSKGRVIGVDKNPQFIRQSNKKSFKIRHEDILHSKFNPRSFNLIHGRYVAIHVANAASLFKKLRTWLKPGGWLVLEEPDFSICFPATGSHRLTRSFHKITKAIHLTYLRRRLDPHFGNKLPKLFSDAGLKSIHVDYEAHFHRGGNKLPVLMGMSACQLKEEYIRTKAATRIDISNYLNFSRDPETWAIYYGTVRVRGKK